MRKKVFLSGVLAVAMAVTLLQPCSVPAEAEDGNAAVTAGPESSLTGDEVELANQSQLHLQRTESRFMAGILLCW